jgi:hypothetical protein
MKITQAIAIGYFVLTVPASAAETIGPNRVINDFPDGSVSIEDGLANWQKFYEVASHPRCVNCHVGPDNRPMWSGPSYGKTRPHGMNINAGENRIGAKALTCSTCHTTLKEPDPKANAMPHAAPRVAQIWGLAPVQAEWLAKSSSEICNQLGDPQRNGNRTIRKIVSHLDHDRVVHWAWNPGGNREPAPHTLQEAMDALMKWAAAGTPCPGQ